MTTALNLPAGYKRYEKVLSYNGPGKEEIMWVLKPGEEFIGHDDRQSPPRAYSVIHNKYGPGKTSFRDEKSESIRRAIQGALRLDAGPVKGGIDVKGDLRRDQSRNGSLEVETDGQIVIIRVDGSHQTCCGCFGGSDSRIDVDMIVKEAANANSSSQISTASVVASPPSGNISQVSVQEELEQFLREHPDRIFTPPQEMEVLWTPIHEIAYQSRTDLLSELLRTRNDILKGMKGYTPLHSACRKGSLVMVVTLVEKEPGLLKEFAENKYNPLHSALRNENREERKKIISYLLSKNPSLGELKPQMPLSALTLEQLTALCEAIPSVSQLKELDLRGNGITSTGAAVVNKALVASSSIQVLLLGDNKDLKEEGIQALQEGLARFCLEEVSLKKVDLTDLGAKYLVQSLQRGSLKKLDLSHNNIGDTGAVFLAELVGKNMLLEDLNLWANQISDDGAKALYKALAGRTEPLKMNLEGNPLSENAKSQLKQLKNHNILI